jgi:hypothetical protein
VPKSVTIDMGIARDTIGLTPPSVGRRDTPSRGYVPLRAFCVLGRSMTAPSVARRTVHQPWMRRLQGAFACSRADGRSLCALAGRLVECLADGNR